MGHLQDMNREQRFKFIAMTIQRRKEANKGHNFQYWNDKIQKQVDDGFLIEDITTHIESYAVDRVSELRKAGNFSRIICGQQKDKQGTKYFTVVYRPKKKKQKST